VSSRAAKTCQAYRRIPITRFDKHARLREQSRGCGTGTRSLPARWVRQPPGDTLHKNWIPPFQPRKGFIRVCSRLFAVPFLCLFAAELYSVYEYDYPRFTAHGAVESESTARSGVEEPL
jgi:hypothetical protein